MGMTFGRDCLVLNGGLRIPSSKEFEILSMQFEDSSAHCPKVSNVSVWKT